MARGISRFADRDLRYGWKYDEKTRKITSGYLFESGLQYGGYIEDGDDGYVIIERL